MDKHVFLQCLSTGKALIESNTAFFAKQTTKKRFEDGKKMEHYLVDVTRAPDGNAVVGFMVPSRSNPNTMRHCFIDIIPKDTNLFTLSQTTKKLADRVKVLKDADVRCFCTCPDFNWNGMKWTMKHKYDSLSGGHHADSEHDDHGEDIAPRVRTPAICAHLIAAFAGMLSNAGTIMKMARQAPPTEETEPELQPEETGEIEHPTIGVKDAEDQSNEVIDKFADEHEKAREEAIDTFQNGEGKVQTEETQEVLDSLADQLATEAEEPENPVIGKYDLDQKVNHLVDYDEEASLPMFDVPLDEEPEEEDELVIEEPQELPKP